MSLMSLATVGRKAPAAAPGHIQPKGGGGGGTPSDADVKAINAGSLQRLVNFIPVESITLFWLAVPAAKALKEPLETGGSDGIRRWLCENPHGLYWLVYGAVLALTPAFLLLVFLSRAATLKDDKGEKLPRPDAITWPWWRAAAAMVAYGVWGLAVPGNPLFGGSEVATMFFWVVAFIASTLLSLIDPIVLNWIFPKQNPEPKT